jgi:F-type H+-transporting ATPase subunit epsilon
MNLKVLLPYQVFADEAEVLRIEAETGDGSFGLLPHRRDCVAALAPGILSYETSGNGTVYLAVDRGVLVKAGARVLVSVRRAIRGTNLGELHDAVRRQFLTLDERERDVRAAVAKMEGSFMRHLEEFAHER